MSTALILLAPNDRPAAVHATPRARADFIAQLIATSSKVPQTRARRRIEPREAVAAYGALGQRPIRLGHALSRSL